MPARPSTQCASPLDLLTTNDGLRGGKTSGGSQGTSSMRVPFGAVSSAAPPATAAGSLHSEAEGPGRPRKAALEPQVEAMSGEDGDRRVVGRMDGVDPEAETLGEEGKRGTEVGARQHGLGCADVGGGDARPCSARLYAVRLPAENFTRGSSTSPGYGLSPRAMG